MIRRPWPALLPLLFTLGACTTTSPGGYFEDDGPHARIPVDVKRVPDATPRNEPLSKGGNRPYTALGQSYTPMPDANGYRERGIASWYGKKFHGRFTSNGEKYDMYAMTAAHKTLPLPSYVRVTNLQNGSSVVVRVNDRGPFRHNRLIDLSYAAAARLGIIGSGTGIVEVVAVTAGDAAPTVAAAPAPTAPAATRLANGATLWLQLGSFSNRDNAEALRLRVAEARLGTVSVQSANVNGNPVYRVRLGPIANVDDGDALADKVRDRFAGDALLVVD